MYTEKDFLKKDLNYYPLDVNKFHDVYSGALGEHYSELENMMLTIEKTFSINHEFINEINKIVENLSEATNQIVDSLKQLETSYALNSDDFIYKLKNFTVLKYDFQKLYDEGIVKYFKIFEEYDDFDADIDLNGIGEFIENTVSDFIQNYFDTVNLDKVIRKDLVNMLQSNTEYVAFQLKATQYNYNNCNHQDAVINELHNSLIAKYRDEIIPELLSEFDANLDYSKKFETKIEDEINKVILDNSSDGDKTIEEYKDDLQKILKLKEKCIFCDEQVDISRNAMKESLEVLETLLDYQYMKYDKKTKQVKKINNTEDTKNQENKQFLKSTVITMDTKGRKNKVIHNNAISICDNRIDVWDKVVQKKQDALNVSAS